MSTSWPSFCGPCLPGFSTFMDNYIIAIFTAPQYRRLNSEILPWLCPGMRESQASSPVNTNAKFMLLPKAPCSRMVYTWAQGNYMGALLGPKYILYSYMEPSGLILSLPTGISYRHRELFGWGLERAVAPRKESLRALIVSLNSRNPIQYRPPKPITLL